nr:MAG TPA: hypothetical protein [Caudoviricetes sp.]
MKKLSTDSISHVRKKAREKGGSGRVKGCGEGQHLLYWFKSNLRRDFQVDLGVRRIEDLQAASKGSALGLRSNFRQPGEDFGMTFRMGEARQPSEGTLMDDLQRASVFKRGSCFGRTRTSASKRRTYFFIVHGPRRTLLLYHTSQGNERRRGHYAARKEADAEAEDPAGAGRAFAGELAGGTGGPDGGAGHPTQAHGPDTGGSGTGTITHITGRSSSMNNYRITYELEDKSLQTQIVERSEAAARKEFKVRVKGSTITDVELVAENVPATKDQERDALATIKKLVEDLGPQSYLATAFEGCFQDAEDNIENDFAFSMKARYEAAEEKLRELGGDYNAVKTDAARAQERLEELGRLVETLKDENRALTVRLAKRTFPEELRRDLWMMATGEAEESRARMAKAAHMMALCADNPACVGFKESVAEYRKEEKRAKEMETRAAALDALEPKGK